MRVAKPDKYDNSKTHVTRKVAKVEPFDRTIVLMTPKAKIKFVKKVEQFVRSSMEYKQFIAYLKENIDMTHCSYFNNVTTKGSRKVSIEIHHEPFTLFDITQIVVAKWEKEFGEESFSHLHIAEEVMRLHYQGRVGLIPVSATVHGLVHAGKIIIPLQNVYGKYTSFVEEYGAYISDDILEMLEGKVAKSKSFSDSDMSILDKKYVYLDVDGFTFPEPVEVE